MDDLEIKYLEGRNFHVLENLVVCVGFIFVVLGAQGYDYGDALNSRLATVYSLVKYGTWYIDRPQDEDPILFEQRTIDKVYVNDHIISSKPPVLPLFMAAECVLMNKILGWDLDVKAEANRMVRVINMTLVGFAYVVTLGFFLKTTRLFIPDPLTRGALLLSLAFGTQLWGYSTHMNNHVPAAALIMVATYLAMGLGMGKLAARPWRFFLFGICAGLVPTIDMPGTIFVAFAGFYLLWKHPHRTFIWAGLGAFIPLATHAYLMYTITGSILPVQTRNDLYLYEGSYWRNPRGVDALNQPKGEYLFNMTLGRCGIFSLFPILLVGMASSLRALFKKSMPFRSGVLAGACAFFILTVYYVVKTNNYGGEAYGFRWYIVAMPILLLMGAPILVTMRVRWKWYFVALLIGVSFYSAAECYKRPWGANNEWTCRYFLGPTYGPVPQANNDDWMRPKMETK